MAFTFFDTGNIGAAPIVRDVPTDTGTTKVINLRVYFDNHKKTGQGYEEQPGLWADVSLFGQRSERLHSLLKKGARIIVHGKGHMETYQDNSGNEQSGVKIIADSIGLDPIAIESVVYRKKNDSEAITHRRANAA